MKKQNNMTSAKEHSNSSNRPPKKLIKQPEKIKIMIIRKCNGIQKNTNRQFDEIRKKIYHLRNSAKRSLKKKIRNHGAGGSHL
jgi:hypothetical protein